MLEGATFEAFHFLRPAWLLVIPLAILLHLRLRRLQPGVRQWQQVIAPHLLAHLSVGGAARKRLRPYQLMTVVWILAAIALAGPTWQREITPFTEDRAPLIVALKLTPSMLAVDQQPTRLERAKQKLRDLLALRKGARTAVIAYAGSAHAVLPLTDDLQLLEIYLESLSPQLMPLAGDAPDRALELAQSMLTTETAAGTIVFMTDGIDRRFADVFADHAAQFADQLLFLAFGTEEGGSIRLEDDGAAQADLAPGLDLAGLRTVADAGGGSVLLATPDSTDVERLVRRIRTHLVNAIEADENLQWHDAGYYLVWPLALLVLVWFRRGWTVVWR